MSLFIPRSVPAPVGPSEALDDAAANALSILDFTDDPAGVANGTIAADDAFARMIAASIAASQPARLPKGSYRLAGQAGLPPNLKLFLDDGAELFFDDDSLESGLLVEGDGVEIYGGPGSGIRGPRTASAGRTGACLIIRGTENVILGGFTTTGGKYGLMSLDNDNLTVRNVVVKTPYNWGFLVAGTRNSRFSDCGVETTRASSASDCFKVLGQYAPAGSEWSTRSTYNIVFDDCYGNNAKAGQVFDIIGANDAADDLHHIYISNPTGRHCGAGFFEIKLAEDGGSFTNYPLHDVYISGGSYLGSGAELTGVYMADRIYNIVVDGTTIHDVQQGVNVANPARYIQLKNVTTVRTRQEGIEWGSGAGAGVMCQIIDCTIINPNYKQVSSTHSGLKFSAGSNILVRDIAIHRTQETSGSAHPYSVEIGPAASRIRFEGSIALYGHAVAPVHNTSTSGNCSFPATIKSPEVSLAARADTFDIKLGAIQSAFVVCAVGVQYTEASNVARMLSSQGRSASASIPIQSSFSSRSAPTDQYALTMLRTPVRLSSSFRSLNLSVERAELPPSPTGKIIYELYGYYDAANLA